MLNCTLTDSSLGEPSLSRNAEIDWLYVWGRLFVYACMPICVQASASGLSVPSSWAVGTGVISGQENLCTMQASVNTAGKRTFKLGLERQSIKELELLK